MTTTPTNNDSPAWLENPDVVALSEKINEITKNLDEFQATLAPIDLEMSEVDKEKEAYMAQVRRELEAFEAKKHAAAQQRRVIEDQLRQARQLKMQLEQNMTNKVNEIIEQDALSKAQERFDSLIADNEFFWKDAIRPFQLVASREAAAAVLEGKFGYGILDQMGLGKTLEATAAIDMIHAGWQDDDSLLREFTGLSASSLSSNAVLWVCPNSIKVTTEREIQKWAPERVVVQLEGDAALRKSMVKHAHMAGAVLIVSYEQLRNRKGKPVTPELFDYSWPIIVTDEAHKYKSDTSSTFENIEHLCRKAAAFLPMTGTPILNRPEEFWSILHMMSMRGIYQDRFRDKWQFEQEYVGYGYFDSDCLIKRVKDVVIRRKKDEVALELPDKERIVHTIELGYEDERANYDAMRDSFAIMIEENEDKEYISANSILAVFTRLRQLALWQPGVIIKRPDGTDLTVNCDKSSKIDYCMELIEELLDNDEKVLVFSNYNSALSEVQRRVHALELERDWFTDGRKVKSNLVIGGQNAHDRADVVDRFNDPQSRSRVLCGNIAAMGIGLNLQGACSNAIFLDMFWNPGTNEQAEDRLHRGGQKNNVMIHYIQAIETIDGFIAKKVEDKANLIEGIIERSELRRALDEGLI